MVFIHNITVIVIIHIIIPPLHLSISVVLFVYLFACLFAWWRHQMETISASLAVCAGNSLITGEFPTQRPVARSFDVFFDLRLNKRLSKQSWGWWLETPSRSLWRHCNGMSLYMYVCCLPLPVTLPAQVSRFYRSLFPLLFPPPSLSPRKFIENVKLCQSLFKFLKYDATKAIGKPTWWSCDTPATVNGNIINKEPVSGVGTICYELQCPGIAGSCSWWRYSCSTELSQRNCVDRGSVVNC